MTWLWTGPDKHLPRAPRVENLQARGGMRDDHWRSVRRRLDPMETTPLPMDAEASTVETVCEYCRVHRWPGRVAVGIGLFLLAATLAIIEMALADFIVGVTR